MSSPNQIKKDTSRVFINLLQLDLDDEEESIFIRILRDMMLENGIEAIVLLSYEDLRNIKDQADKQGTGLPFYLVTEIKSLQFYLKHLQEKGMH